MAILNIHEFTTGLVGVVPKIVYIETDDSVATVLTAGYLTRAKQSGYQFDDNMMALVKTTTDVMWAEISVSGGSISLVVPVNPGTVQLPVVDGHIAAFVGTTGLIGDDPAIAINGGNIQAGLSGTAGYLASFPATALRGSLRLTAVANAGNTLVTISNADHAQATVISIPDGGQATTEFIIADSAGTQNITSGGFQVDAGAISSGLAAGGFAGNLVLHPNTTASGNVALLAVDNATGDFDTVISNAAAVAQDQVITIPDSGAATANFLLDTGAANILTDYSQVVGINEILIAATGTWTRTRIAQGNYALVKSAADETSNVSFDITPQIRTQASKGFRLASLDVIYQIVTEALDAHTLTVDEITYADNVAVAVTSVPVTGALATATQANLYVTNVAVDTPAFLVTADSKYVVELTVDSAATTVYSLYGLNLHFSQTVA